MTPLDGESSAHVRSLANMANTTLGDEIRRARVLAGHGLRELARSLDITPSYLSDIENDRRVPSEEVLQNLASALRLDFDRLMGLAGRFGDEAERLLKRSPETGLLFRRLSSEPEPEKLVREFIEQLDQKRRERGE